MRLLNMVGAVELRLLGTNVRPGTANFQLQISE
jgi:hypothetical protein